MQIRAAFEFLKQTLTLGLAGIAGVAALFTDPTRIPADTVSKWAILGGAIGLGGVVLFAIMGLSSYANLLTATASSDAVVRKCAPTYAKGVRDHARVVVLALTVAFIGIGFFACYRLFSAPTTGTPESAIEMAAALISKETKQPPDRLYLMRMEADDDAFTVTYQVAATSSEGNGTCVEEGRERHPPHTAKEALTESCSDIRATSHQAPPARRFMCSRKWLMYYL